MVFPFAFFQPIPAADNDTLNRFNNDFEACAAIQWVRYSPNNWLSGSIAVWYPRFSKHYVSAHGNPNGLPRQQLGQQLAQSQMYNQMGSTSVNARRHSNPFRGQQPIDVASSYGGSMQNNFQNAASNGQIPGNGLTPAQGMAYQQVTAQMPPRGLFDPDAPRRVESRVETRGLPHAKVKPQQPASKSNSSKDPAVRVNKIMGHDTWRPLQTKSLSEEAVFDEENDAAGNLKDTTSSHSSVKSSAREPTVCAASRSITPEVVDKVKGITQQAESEMQDNRPQGPQIEQAVEQQPEKHLPQKESLKTKSCKKSQPEKSHKQQAAAANSKLSDKRGEQGGTSSQNAAALDPKTTQQQSQSSTESSTATLAATNTTVDSNPQNAASSDTITPEPTKDVQHDDRRAATEAESTAADNDVEKTATSSLATAPDATKFVQREVTTHRKKTTSRNNNYDAGGNKNAGKPKARDISKKDQQKKGPEAKQSGYRKTAADLTVSVERLEDEAAKREAATEVSSAVGEANYPTDTVIRHKTTRPTFPVEWADDVDDKLSTRTPSPPVDTLPKASVANRFSNISVQMANAANNDANEANATKKVVKDMLDSAIAILSLNQASASKENAVDHKESESEPVASATESAPQAEQKAGRDNRFKSKFKQKGKAQDASSHLTSRSNTPTLTDTQSRGPSPLFDRPSSAATPSDASSRGPSPAMQNYTKPKKQHNHQNKQKRNLTLLEPGTSEGLAKTDEKEAAPSAVEAVDESQFQAKPVNEAGKSHNAKFRANTAGNSLRIAKQRSTTSATTSLTAIFEPPVKTGWEASAPAVHKNPTTAETKESEVLPALTQDKPKSQGSSSKSTKNGEDLSLPEGSPFPPLAPTVKPSGNWAAVAKSGASTLR